MSSQYQPLRFRVNAGPTPWCSPQNKKKILWVFMEAWRARHPHVPEDPGAKLQNVLLVCAKENLPEKDHQVPVPEGENWKNRITRNSYRIVIATGHLRTLPQHAKSLSTKHLAGRHTRPTEQGDLFGAGHFWPPRKVSLATEGQWCYYYSPHI